MISDANFKAQPERPGSILLALGVAALILVPVRADDDLDPSGPLNAENHAAPALINSKPVESDQNSQSDAAEIERLRNNCRANAVVPRGCPHDLIGGVAQNKFWRKNIPLAEKQSGALTKLDSLVQKMHAISYQSDAKYPVKALASYRTYLDRSDERRQEVIRHAERMVTVGFLTEPQAAVVYYRWSSMQPQLLSLRNENFQDLLAMTGAQKMKFADVLAEFNRAHEHMNVMHQRGEKEDKAKRAAIDQAADEALQNILTQDQHETWSRLTAQRPMPVEPPSLAPFDSSVAEATSKELLNLSPVFRVLIEQADPLGLSDEQKDVLKDLEEMTRDGLMWISLGRHQGPFPPGDARNDGANPVAQTRAEFVNHAEQIVLLGILAERQAEQVQAVP